MTLTYANRMNLVTMTPQPSLCSTHFCLVDPGKEYLVYQPYAAHFTVNLEREHTNMNGLILRRT